MKKLPALLFLLLFTTSAQAKQPAHIDDDVYAIESAVTTDGGNFIINGVEFAAKGICHDYRFGDTVIFLTGNPTGECTEATIANLRNNESCDVWCQYPL